MTCSEYIVIAKYQIKLKSGKTSLQDRETNLNFNINRLKYFSTSTTSILNQNY